MLSLLGNEASGGKPLLGVVNAESLTLLPGLLTAKGFRGSEAAAALSGVVGIVACELGGSNMAFKA